jgi:two-component system, chemotaxis family, chemotaxis protein CheY
MWKILIADDDFYNRKLLVEILKGKADCDIAANGKETIEAYDLSVSEKKPYDLLLLDIGMPDIDGIQVLRKIRESEHLAGVNLGDGIPVLMVTGYKEPAIEAFNGGCDDYIIKPIDAKILIEKVRSKLGQNA